MTKKFEPSKLLALAGRRLDAAVALLDSGAADVALKAQEAATLARRRELIGQLGAVDARHQATTEAAAKAYAAAVNKRTAAQAALQEAFKAEAAAMGAAYSASYSPDRERADIERDLAESCDPRVDRFDFLLDQLDDGARNALSGYMRPHETRLGRGVAYVLNANDVRAARTVIRELRSEVAEMRMAAISYDDLTTQFIAMCERLAAPLAELRLNPPQVDGEGRIEAPLPFGMLPRKWRMDVARPQPHQPDSLFDDTGLRLPMQGVAS